MRNVMPFDTLRSSTYAPFWIYAYWNLPETVAMSTSIPETTVSEPLTQFNPPDTARLSICAPLYT